MATRKWSPWARSRASFDTAKTFRRSCEKIRANPDFFTIGKVKSNALEKLVKLILLARSLRVLVNGSVIFPKGDHIHAKLVIPSEKFWGIIEWLQKNCSWARWTQGLDCLEKLTALIRMLLAQRWTSHEENSTSTLPAEFSTRINRVLLFQISNALLPVSSLRERSFLSLCERIIIWLCFSIRTLLVRILFHHSSSVLQRSPTARPWFP